MSKDSSSKIPLANDGYPRRVLTLFDCVCIIIGTIIGAGIFKIPAVIASNVPGPGWLFAVWIAGGAIALIGALCFAELTTTYPDRGGDYGYLKRAYHPRVGFAFSWTAFWIIRPANIGAMAMIFGEFAQRAFPDSASLLVYAIASVVLMTVTNLIGVTFGKLTQNLLTVAKVAGILVIVVGSFVFWSNPPSESNSRTETSSAETATDSEEATATDNQTLSTETETADGAAPESTWDWFWLSMVFVMFTFGGWNDIAFVATEVREPQKNLLWSLVLGTLMVLGIYLLVNLALIDGLGFEKMAELGSVWKNATSVLVEQNMGSVGGRLFAVLVCVSCIGAINAMIFTSPRIYWATAVDYPRLKWLAGSASGKGWWRAMSLQAIVTVLFISAFGSRSSGFENLAAANAPYFWLFLGLTVIGIIVLRVRTRGQFSGYRVPFYPVLPLVFASACGFMIYRGLQYMSQQNLEIQALVIGGWVLLGFVLSILLEKNDAPQTNESNE